MGGNEVYNMKVLIFTSQIHLLGGAEKLAVELAEGLNSQPGVQADVLCMGSEDIPGTVDTKQRLLNNGVPSVGFLGRRPGTSGRGMWAFVLKLRRILQTGGYDFIETSMPGPTMLACWAVRGLGTQLIVGIHDIYRRDHQSGWSYKFLRFSVSLNRSVKFYAISEQAKAHWLKYARVESERVCVIYNSIAANHFRNTEEGLCVEGIPEINGDEYKVLFVGRLCKRKGLDTLIEALGPILRKEKVHLFIVGRPNSKPETFYPEEGNMVEQLTKQVADSDWSNRVHFLGGRDDIPQLMAFADVLVHPARKEGFGLVLAEALAAGLPIIATNIDGIPEVLADTDSVLVPPDDPTAVRQALLKVLNRTPQETAYCRRMAQQRAEFFRPERRVADMLALFHDLSAPIAVEPKLL